MAHHLTGFLPPCALLPCTLLWLLCVRPCVVLVPNTYRRCLYPNFSSHVCRMWCLCPRRARQAILLPVGLFYLPVGIMLPALRARVPRVHSYRLWPVLVCAAWPFASKCYGMLLLWPGICALAFTRLWAVLAFSLACCLNCMWYAYMASLCTTRFPEWAVVCTTSGYGMVQAFLVLGGCYAAMLPTST